jgi:hypothetical protein
MELKGDWIAKEGLERDFVVVLADIPSASFILNDSWSPLDGLLT